MAVDPKLYAKALRNSSNRGDAHTYYMNNGGNVADSAELNRLLDQESPSSFGNSSGGGGGGVGSNKPFYQQILSSQQSTSKIADIGENDSIDAMSFLLFDSAIERKKRGNEEIIKQTKRESDLHTEIAEKVGLQGRLLEAHHNAIAESSITALKYGYSMSHVTELVTTMSDKTALSNVLSKELLDRSAETGRAFVGSLYKLGDAYAEFEKVGIGAKNTLDAIDKTGRASMSLGLNAKKTTEMLKNEIGKLNEYGFSNGVLGLNRMVQRSIELRMNLGEVFKVAEKVMNPDSAIELTANMQMLGGAIGDLNDPLKLMYMATNNVEGLQDAMMGAVQNLATYNEEQQRFEVTGVNLRRVREMANAMGVDYKELTKGAIAAQERMMAVDELMGKGFDMSEADREFIVNMSKMKDGKMTITIPQGLSDKFEKSEMAIDELSKAQIDEIVKVQKELADKTPEDIAMGSFTELKQISNYMKVLVQGEIRGVVKETTGEGGSVNIEQLTGSGTKETFRALALKQQVGESGLLGTTITGIMDEFTTIIGGSLKNLNAAITAPIKSLVDELKIIAKKPGTPEQERKKQEIEDTRKKSEPSVFIHKHEFKILSNFASAPIEHKGSFTIP